MNGRDIRRYDRAARVATFGKTNDADFAADSLARGHFANVGRLLGEIDQAKAGQTPARVSKETLLDALMLDFKRVAATARSIEKQDEERGFAAPYVVPERTEIAITSHADKLLGLVEDGETDSAEEKAATVALRARFIAYEIATDFVTRMRADRDAIDEANEHNETEVRGGVENTALIGELLGKISAEVEYLDTIVGNKYQRQPEKLRAWDTASRIERAAVKAKKEKPANGAVTLTTPTWTAGPQLAPQPVLQPTS